MEIKNSKRRSFDIICKCCLRNSHVLKDLWCVNSVEGEQGIYGEMITKCFAISWQKPVDRAELICETCIKRLLIAFKFKRDVLASERILREQLQDEDNESNEIVEEKYIKDSIIQEDFISDEDSDNEDVPDNLEYFEETVIEDNIEGLEYFEVEYLEDNVNVEPVKLEKDAIFMPHQQENTKENKECTGKDKKNSLETTTRPILALDRYSPKKPKQLRKESRLNREVLTKTHESIEELKETNSEVNSNDLQLCLNAVKSERLTAVAASVMYNVPMSTINRILAGDKDRPSFQIGDTKVRMVESQVQKSKGQKTDKSDQSSFRVGKVNVKRVKVLTDEQLKLAQNIAKRKKQASETTANPFKTVTKDDGALVKRSTERTQIRDTELEHSEQNFEVIENECVEEIQEPHEECTTPIPYGNRDDERKKHQDNLVSILTCSNATPFQNYSDDLGFSCGFCTERYQKPADLKRHTLLEHHDEKATYMNDRELSIFRVKIDITSLQCQLCDKAIETLEELLEHLKIDHNETVHTDLKNQIMPFKFLSDTFSCFMCGFEFYRFRQLSIHMRVHYNNYICEICGAAFISRADLRLHSYRHKIGVYACTVCSMVFKNHYAKAHHERSAHRAGGLLRTTCNLCSTKFRSETVKWKHQFEVHGIAIPRFKCKSCDVSYSTQGSLAKHEKQAHLKLKQAKCPECGQEFFDKKCLRRHMSSSKHKLRISCTEF